MTPNILVFRKNNEIRTIVPDNHPLKPAILCEFRRTLCYTRKELVPLTRVTSEGVTVPTGERKTRRRVTPVYEALESPVGTQLVTFQGLLPEVETALRNAGAGWKVLDGRRAPLPVEPQHAGHFRFGQKDVFDAVLATRDSGSIVLPTRYGKSYVMKNLVVAHPTCRIMLLMPGVDLLRQQAAFMEKWIPKADIGLVCGTKCQAQRRVVFVSLDSIHKLSDSELDAFDLVIGDEIHSAGSPERIPQIARIGNARILGLTATPEGRFDNADMIVRGMFGPPLVRKTYREAVKEGAICPIVVYAYQVFLDDAPEGLLPDNRTTTYRRGHYLNKDRRELLKTLLEEVIPADWQTLVFIDTNKQADYLAKRLEVPHQLAIAGRFSGKKDRDAVNASMASGNIKRCLATGIYSQGVTFSNLRCMVNYSGGGGSITSIQKPGRMAEVREGKKFGYMIDIQYRLNGPASLSNPGAHHLVRDSAARRKTYEQLGYTLVEVTSTKQIRLF